MCVCVCVCVCVVGDVVGEEVNLSHCGQGMDEVWKGATGLVAVLGLRSPRRESPEGFAQRKLCEARTIKVCVHVCVCVSGAHTLACDQCVSVVVVLLLCVAEVSVEGTTQRADL